MSKIQRQIGVMFIYFAFIVANAVIFAGHPFAVLCGFLAVTGFYWLIDSAVKS